jgi:hypothetical protein
MHHMNTTTTYTTYQEREAIEAMREAVKRLEQAFQASQQCGFGSQVIGPLFDAIREARYALDVSEGRA